MLRRNPSFELVIVYLIIVTLAVGTFIAQIIPPDIWAEWFGGA